MSAETIPAEVLYLIRKGGLFYRPNSQGYTAHTFDAGRYTLAEAEAITHPNGPDGPRDGLSYAPAPADRSTRPAEPAAPTVDTIAAFLHKEVEWPEHTYPAYTWPEVDGDTGQRDGGYVKIVPKYVVEEFRGIARRLLIAFRQEGAVSAEPAAPVAEAGGGDGDVAAEQIAAVLSQAEVWVSEADWRTVPRMNGPAMAKTIRSTLEAERARADELSQERDQALIQIKANIAAIDRAKEFVRVAEQRAADALALVKELEFGAGFEAAFDAVVRPGSRYENWMPADDPAEIVTDLYNDLEDALARAEKAEGALETAQEERKAASEAMRHVGAHFPECAAEFDAIMDRNAAHASREAQPATDGGGA